MTLNDSRTWRPTPEGGPIAPQILNLNDSAVVTVGFDFCELLNHDDSLASVVEVVEDGTTNTPTIASEVISSDKQRVEFSLSGLSAGDETRIRADALTTNGDRISVLGWTYTI